MLYLSIHLTTIIIFLDNWVANSFFINRTGERETMTAVRALYQLLNINLRSLSKKELVFLEADLFTRICEELKEIIRYQNKDYFRLLKLNKEKENTMIETNFIRCIINDILSTEEYNLAGIAYYAAIPQDIIYEVASGCNLHPTLALARKIIDLHRSVRANLYREIMKKIISKLPQD